MISRAKAIATLVSVAGLTSIAATFLVWLGPAYAQEAEQAARFSPQVLQWGFIAAALATGLSSLGAAYAVATVGSAAIGAVTEKPELMGRVLIMVGLAEGIAIYGLIISIIILNQLV